MIKPTVVERPCACDTEALEARIAELEAVLQGMQEDRDKYLTLNTDYNRNWFISRVLWRLNDLEHSL